jgi:hypothetical protein
MNPYQLFSQTEKRRAETGKQMVELPAQFPQSKEKSQRTC